MKAKHFSSTTTEISFAPMIANKRSMTWRCEYICSSLISVGYKNRSLSPRTLSFRRSSSRTPGKHQKYHIVQYNAHSQAIPHVEEHRAPTPKSDSIQALPTLNHNDPVRLEDQVGTTSEKPPSSEDSNSKNIVDFESPEDPYKPLNWPTSKKITTTLLYGFTTAGATWASSIYSVAIGTIAEEFEAGEVVSTLGLTLFLFGFGLGPLL
jgi:hypothetical protein